MSEAPVLVQVQRSGLVESTHRGHVAVVDENGELVAALGDPDLTVYPRSSMKPLQAAGMLAAGLDLRGRLLALASASHSGEDFHANGVREILELAGTNVDALQCPPDWPYGEQARIDHIAAGGAKQRVLMNCSGKHAAMLRTCALNDWPLVSYLHPEHPLQVHLRAEVGRMTGSDQQPASTDGCGAPLWGVPLVGLAKAFAGLAADPGGAHVVEAFGEHPEYAGGTGRDVTDLNLGVPGLAAKDGAEAMQTMAVRVGDRRYGVALKIADGGQRARPVVAAAVLARLGVTAPVVTEQLRWPVLGGGASIGAIEPAPALSEFAGL